MVLLIYLNNNHLKHSKLYLNLCNKMPKVNHKRKIALVKSVRNLQQLFIDSYVITSILSSPQFRAKVVRALKILLRLWMELKRKNQSELTS